MKTTALYELRRSEPRGDCGGEEEFTLTPSAPECSEYSLPKKNNFRAVAEKKKRRGIKEKRRGM